MRLVVADPHGVFRLGVQSVLREERDFEVVEAADLWGLEACLTVDPEPDLALVDLDLPPRGAVEAVHLLREVGTPTIVWAPRSRLTSDVAFDVVRAGSIGLLNKEISGVGLTRALRGVAHGEAPFTRDLVRTLVDGLQSATQGARARSQMSILSGREREVLELVSEGRSNRQIAARLFVSEFTAKRHVQNILRKLDVHSRSEASALYYSYHDQSPSRLGRRVADEPALR